MIAIFSQSGDRERLSVRIVDIARVPVRQGDGLPTTICQPCKRRLLALEKAVVGLNEFCKQCQDTYQTMVLFPGTVSTQSNHTVYAQSESLKRPKESSSSIGVSPDTARCRPPSKRPSGVARSLLFSFDSCELVHACSIKCLHFDANFILSSSTMYAD